MRFGGCGVVGGGGGAVGGWGGGGGLGGGWVLVCAGVRFINHNVLHHGLPSLFPHNS